MKSRVWHCQTIQTCACESDVNMYCLSTIWALLACFGAFNCTKTAATKAGDHTTGAVRLQRFHIRRFISTWLSKRIYISYPEVTKRSCRIQYWKARTINFFFFNGHFKNPITREWTRYMLSLKLHVGWRIKKEQKKKLEFLKKGIKLLDH